MGPLIGYLLEGILRLVPAERMATYAGKAIVVIDPTECQKRSRGKGKGDNHMQHIGRVRKSHSKRQRKKKAGSNGKAKAKAPSNASGQPEKTATTTGYVDVWDRLVLTGKQFLPLARQLFSSKHPKLKSQNKVEEVDSGLGLQHNDISTVRRKVDPTAGTGDCSNKTDGGCGTKIDCWQDGGSYEPGLRQTTQGLEGSMVNVIS